MVGTQRESLEERLFAKKHMPFLHLIGAGPQLRYLRTGYSCRRSTVGTQHGTQCALRTQNTGTRLHKWFTVTIVLSCCSADSRS